MPETTDVPVQTLAALVADANLLDWLDEQNRAHDGWWVARASHTGRGFRLYMTSNPAGARTVREAIRRAQAVTP